MKKALITGITGQDGSYLAELLVEQGYDVFGMVPRRSAYDIEHPETLGTMKFLSKETLKSVQFHWGDVADRSSVREAIEYRRPDEVYNLAAQSHVHVSYSMPEHTINVNATGALNLLEEIRLADRDIKFYQASTSEMFGNSIDFGMFHKDYKQNEDTPFEPASPYAVAKVEAHHLTQLYRNSYGFFACSGILFNHESPRRGHNFVTSKVVRGALQIAKDNGGYLRLGNLQSRRDWGHAKDYVRAMWMMMQQDLPDDYVIATGVTRSISELCDVVFTKVGFEDYANNIVADPQFYRPDDVHRLCGDSTKAKRDFGWEPTYTFESMIDEMIEYHAQEMGVLV